MAVDRPMCGWDSAVILLFLNSIKKEPFKGLFFLRFIRGMEHKFSEGCLWKQYKQEVNR